VHLLPLRTGGKGFVSVRVPVDSFAAEFDANRPIMLEGVVQRMEFTNPHSWIYVEVTLDNGEVEEWAIEGAAPNALLRRGWNRQSLPAGTRIRVRGFQARDRSNRAAGTDVTLPDGSELFVGSVGIGAAPGFEDRDLAPLELALRVSSGVGERGHADLLVPGYFPAATGSPAILSSSMGSPERFTHSSSVACPVSTS
jgi:hypothetical protein